MGRLSIRLSIETNQYIEELQKIYTDELDNEIKFTKSQVCSRSYFETKDGINWKEVQNARLKLINKEIDKKYKDDEIRATLNLDNRLIEAINEHLITLPTLFGAKWLTKGFIIKMFVKSALINYIRAGRSSNYVIVE